MNWSLIILNGTLVALALTLMGYLLSREKNAHEGFGGLSWLLAFAAIIQVTTVDNWLDNWNYIAAGLILAFIWGLFRVALDFKKDADPKKLQKVTELNFAESKDLYDYIRGLKSKEELLASFKIRNEEDDEYTEDRVRKTFYRCLKTAADSYRSKNQTSPIRLEINPEAYSLLKDPRDDNVELFKAAIDLDTVIGSSIVYGVSAPFSILNFTIGRALRYVVIDILYTKYIQEIQKISQKWFKDLFKF